MSYSQLFRELAKHRRLIEKHKDIFQLFCAAFEVTDNLNQIANLQKEFIITELCFSYSHFGYSLFASSSVELTKKGLEQQCGVEPSFVEKYLINLKEFLCDEIRFEKKTDYFSENGLELSFAREFIKRIFCTESEEDIQTGMCIFDKNHVNVVRNLAKKKILELDLAVKPRDDGGLREDHHSWSSRGMTSPLKIQNLMEERKSLYFDNIYNEFAIFIEQYKIDPRVLAIGRFESFISFSKNNLNSLFIFRENNNFIDEKSKKITAILNSFLTHKQLSGQLLAKKNMLTLEMKNCLQDENEFDLLLEEAIQCGVMFKVPQGNKRFSYGLTDGGMKIIQSFCTN